MMHRVYRSWASIFAVTTMIACAAAAEPTHLSREQRNAEWAQLFDGKTLTGWRPTGEAEWRVENDTIVTKGDKPGWLMTTTEWSNFELQLEFKAPEGTNSGVFLRSALEPTDPTKDCYELNIAPADNPFPTGSLVGRKKLALAAEDFPAADQWHKLQVTAVGGHWTVALDGRQVLEYADPAPLVSGHIGLQSKQGPVSFCNLRVRTFVGQ